MEIQHVQTTQYRARLLQYVGPCRARLYASIALLTGDASVHATNRTCMCRHASTDATHLTCKYVEIWLSLEFMTMAKSDF